MGNFLNPLATITSPDMMAQGVWFLPVFILLLVWSFIWKGWALWRAARTGSKVWFIVFLLVNTVGILEIIYIFVITKTKEVKAVEQPTTPPVAS